MAEVKTVELKITTNIPDASKKVNELKESLKGVKTEAGSLNEEVTKSSKLGEVFGNIAGGYVPTVVSDVGEVEDEFQRTGSSYKKGEKINTTSDLLRKQGRGFKNSFLKRIPLARHYADPSDTSVPQEERGGMLRRAIRAADLFNFRTDKPYTAPRAQ